MSVTLKRIIVPVGFPGSGKSSWIRKQRDNILPCESVVISGDDIRLMLWQGAYKFSGYDTDLLICCMIDMARTFLHRYNDVFLDEYYISYNKQARANLKTLIGDKAHVEFFNMDVDLGTCIHRRCTDNREDDTSRWPNVLLEMVKDFEQFRRGE